MSGELFGRDDVRLQVQVAVGAYGGGISGTRWDEALWDDPEALWGGTDLTWDTITCSVKQFTSRRGRSDADGRFAVGTGQVVLDNFDDEWTLGGSQLRLGGQLRVRALIAGLGTVTLFTGQVTALDQDDDVSGASTVTCQLADSMSYFAAQDNPAEQPQGAGELPGARIARILDDVAWPAQLRDIDAGTHPLQATTLAGNVMAELLLTADSEGGALFVDPEGVLVFRDRDWLTGKPLVGSITATDPLDGLPYVCGAGATVDYSQARVRNVINLAARAPSLDVPQLEYVYRLAGAATPAAGDVRLHDLGDGTWTIRIHEQDATGLIATTWLDYVDPGDFIILTDATQSDQFTRWRVLSASDEGSYYLYTVVPWETGDGGAPAGDATVLLTLDYQPATYTVSDPASVAVHGPRTVTRTDLLCEDAADVQWLADRLLADRKDARPRATSATVRLHDPAVSAADALWLAGLAFGDRLRVGTSRWQLEGTVQGIAHMAETGPANGADPSASSVLWTMTVQTDDAFIDEPMSLLAGPTPVEATGTVFTRPTIEPAGV